jgi:hypothetical protein
MSPKLAERGHGIWFNAVTFSTIYQSNAEDYEMKLLHERSVFTTSQYEESTIHAELSN